MLKASTVHTCVLYDPKNGQIVHVHKEITIGQSQRTEAEIEKRARMFASRHRSNTTEGRRDLTPGDIERLKAVFVKDTRSKTRYYKIDTETSKLVEVEASKH